MADLLNIEDFNFWDTQLAYVPFFNVNPQLEKQLDTLSTSDKEMILGTFAVRAYINQPNNSKIPSLLTITNKRILIHRIKGTNTILGATRNVLLGQLNSLTILETGDILQSIHGKLTKNKVANKEMKLYEGIAKLDDPAILNNDNNWKVIYEAHWSDLLKDLTEITFGKTLFVKGTNITFKPKKKKFFSIEKHPTISFIDDTLEVGFVAFIALFKDLLSKHGALLLINPEPAYAFQIRQST